jgi:hypothetical protein
MRLGLRSIAGLPLLLGLAGCSGGGPGNDDEVGDDATDESGTDDTAEGNDTGEALRPNWHQDIAPIVQANCVGCHVQDGIAPFALDEYTSAAAWASLIDEVVAEGLMPPWGAIETDECEPDHGWRNDLRLSDEDKQLIADWVEFGTPEGELELAAPLPEAPSLDLQATTATFQNPSSFSVEPGDDSFICFSIDPGLAQDVWVTGVQMVPDNQKVVHHVLIYADPDANSAAVADANGSYPCFGTAGVDNAKLIGTWVPGAVPTETPDDVGLPLPAGSRIILAYHYHPTGGPAEFDQSEVALRWTEDPPAYEGVMDLIGNIPAGTGLLPGPNDPGGVSLFYIPAGVTEHTETMQVALPDLLPPIQLFTLGNHMHYIGRDMKVTLERDGEERCLIQTPRWDFNWQRIYDIDAQVGSFPTVQGGDVLTIRCTYDNSLANPFLVEALEEQGMSEPINVTLGEASLDEMCLLIYGLAYPNFP